MRGYELLLLQRRLEKQGYLVIRFSYPSLTFDLAYHASQLEQQLKQLTAHTIYFVAHSLGGLLVYQLLSNHLRTEYSKVVTLGTPFQGSLVAQTMEQSYLKCLLGKQKGDSLLITGIQSWEFAIPLGLITGTLSIGVGRLVAKLPKPNDGTVSANESVLIGATDSIAINTSHVGLLINVNVVKQIVCFFKCNRFCYSDTV